MLMPVDLDRSEGVAGFVMPVMLQIATPSARGNVCSLRDVLDFGLLHNADMDDSKNGGPNHLQAWREYREMTQEQLAAAVDTTASVISLIEAGERGLSAKWLRRLAPALRSRPGWILDFRPQDVDAELMEAWEGVPEDLKPQALRVLRSFQTGTGG